MLSYTIELRPRGEEGGDVTVWKGPAVNSTDAFMLARKSVFPRICLAKIIEIGEHNGEPEGN